MVKFFGIYHIYSYIKTRHLPDIAVNLVDFGRCHLFFLHRGCILIINSSSILKDYSLFTDESKVLEEQAMKRSAITLLLTAVFTLWSAQVFAGERELYGALIGAGSGAILGHTIGGNAESVIIGSALGGLLGISVGQIHRQGQPGYPPGNFMYPPQHKPKYKGYHQKPRYQDRHFARERNCHTVKYTTYKHGQRYFTTKRICSDDRGYRGRPYDRHDRYEDRRGRYDDRQYRY